MTSLWGNRSFLLLFSAQVVSLTGSGVTTVGLALFAYQLTGGPSAAPVVGTALMLRILALLLFSQPAGVLYMALSRSSHGPYLGVIFYDDSGRNRTRRCSAR